MVFLRYQEAKARIAEHGGGLDEFSQGYKQFGFNRVAANVSKAGLQQHDTAARKLSTRCTLLCCRVDGELASCSESGRQAPRR